MSDTNTTAPEGVNPVLWRLKSEAEAEVERLRAELAPIWDKVAEAEELERAIERSPSHTTGLLLRPHIPTALELAKLEVTKTRLGVALEKAERRLESELAALRQAETTGTSSIGNRFSRANRELAEVLEAGMRILTEYTAKLDRISDSVSRATAFSDQQRFGPEFLAISEPLQWWIMKLSAIHEEGRLTEPQRMELRLRLSELESKFQALSRSLKKLGILVPT